eukprot:gene197-355_t
MEKKSEVTFADYYRIYVRLVIMLGPELKLACKLVVANILLGFALFVEPVLFGRVIDTLTRLPNFADTISQSPADIPKLNDNGDTTQQSSVERLIILLIIWATFGIFGIVSGTLIAYSADQLAHRRRHVLSSIFYQHVLNMPILQQNDIHSGRMAKIMQQGAETAFWNWLNFLRYVVLRAHTMQKDVEKFYKNESETTSDVLANLPLIQSFSRIELEVDILHENCNKILAAQMPILGYWAVVVVIQRTATTLTMLAIIIVGAYLYMNNTITIGTIVTFISFANIVIRRLEQLVNFVRSISFDAPKLKDFFDQLDIQPSIHDSSIHCIDPIHLKGEIEFNDVKFSYDESLSQCALNGISFTVHPGQTVALVGASGAGKSTALSMLYRAIDPNHGAV